MQMAQKPQPQLWHVNAKQPVKVSDEQRKLLNYNCRVVFNSLLDSSVVSSHVPVAIMYAGLRTIKIDESHVAPGPRALKSQNILYDKRPVCTQRLLGPLLRRRALHPSSLSALSSPEPSPR